MTPSTARVARVAVATCAIAAACVAAVTLTRRAGRLRRDRRARDAERETRKGTTRANEDDAETRTRARGRDAAASGGPSSSRSGDDATTFEDVRGMYTDAMRALSTWNDERGYEPVTRAFRRVAALARDGGDAHLECEATLIVAEIEINAL